MFVRYSLFVRYNKLFKGSWYHHLYSGICALVIVINWIQRVRKCLGAKKAGEMLPKKSDTRVWKELVI